MGRTKLSGVAALVSMLSFGLAEEAAGGGPYNENGWIEAPAWNLLFPLTNPYGCDAGGPVNMLRNWVAPHRVSNESAQDGTRWGDIDFGGTAAATGFEMEDFWRALEPGQSPVRWVTIDRLSTLPGVDPASIPRGDVVDFQRIVEVLNQQAVPAQGLLPILSDNVLGIAQTYVRNTTSSPLCLYVCTRSDDSVQVWVNDKQVTNVSSCRGVDADCSERNPVVIEPGINRISVLTWEGVGGWGFGLALEESSDSQFYKLTELSQDQVLFLGPDLPGAVLTPNRFELTRSSANPDCCPIGNPTRVTLRGNGKNPGGGLVRESYPSSEVLGITGITGGGVLTFDAGTGLYTIEWKTTSTVLNSTGVSYSVNIAPGKTAHPTGEFDFQIQACEPIGGETEIKGSWPHTGPIGAFNDSHDIGTADELSEGPGSLTVAPGPDGVPGTPDDVYTMKGSGKDLWDGGDSFQFAYKKVVGDFSATVRISSRTFPPSGGRWGRYGLMARKDCAPNSKYSLVHADLEVDPPPPADHLRGDAVYYQFRRNHRVNGSTDNSQFLVFPDPDAGGPQLVNQPNYFRLERRGNTFSGSASFDGVSWKPIGSDTWYGSDPAVPVLVGFMYSKHSSAPQSGTIAFTDFKIGPPRQPEVFNDDKSNPVRVLYRSHFENFADGAVPPEIQVNCSGNCGAGGFTPRIVTAPGGAKRLRLTQDGVGDNSTSAFIKGLNLNAGTGKVVIEYTVWMSHVPTAANPVPADGMTLTLIAGDSTTRVGNGGSGLGYDGIGRKSFGDAAPSFAVECDAYGALGNNEGAGSPTAPGRWHLGIDTGGNINSIAMVDSGLPDVFTPAGVRLRVELTSEGHMSVFVVPPGGGGGAEEPILEGQGDPLGDGPLQAGFTGATGGASESTDVGNINLGVIDCSDNAETATITPPGPTTVPPRGKVTLSATASNAGTGDAGELLTFTWFLDPASQNKATLTVNSSTPGTAEVNVLIEDGEVIVGVTVDDHRCPRPVSATATRSIIVGKPRNWVTYDVNDDGVMDISDAVAHIKWHFLGETAPKCKELLDFNGDGGVDPIADAVAEMGFLFLGRPPPPKGLGCQSYPTCGSGCGCGGACPP